MRIDPPGVSTPLDRCVLAFLLDEEEIGTKLPILVEVRGAMPTWAFAHDAAGCTASRAGGGQDRVLVGGEIDLHPFGSGVGWLPGEGSAAGDDLIDVDGQESGMLDAGIDIERIRALPPPPGSAHDQSAVGMAMNIGAAPVGDGTTVQGVVRQDQAIDLVRSADVREVLCVLLQPVDVMVPPNEDLPTIHAGQQFKALGAHGDVTEKIDGVAVLSHDAVMGFDHHLIPLCGTACPWAHPGAVVIGELVDPVLMEVMIGDHEPSLHFVCLSDAGRMPLYMAGGLT